MTEQAQQPVRGDHQPPVSTRILTVPNAISFVRLLLVPVFAVLIATGQDGWAVLVLGVSGASDWLDGVLARRLGQVTRLGQLLDPAADRLFIAVTLVGLVWRGVVPLWLLVVILAREVVLGVMLIVLGRAGFPRRRSTWPARPARSRCSTRSRCC